MFEQLNVFLVSLSGVLPLELFVFVGSFVEEIVAPIPSVLITTLAGTLALGAGYGWLGLLWLSVLASIGKSIGCAILYVIADKAEDFIMVRLGPTLGITHAEVERVGKFFTGGIRDYFILIAVRALPLSPSLPISVGAGIIKIPFGMYNIATFIGNFLRSLLFIAVGYTGFSAYQHLLEQANSLESLIQIALAAALGLFVLWIYYLRRVREKKEPPTRGFTLIELLVVISIIALISTVVLSSLAQAREKAAQSRAALDIRTLNTALQLYYHERGSYPPGPGALSANTSSAGNWTSFINQLRPTYVSAPIVPTFPSIGTATMLSQGYSYHKGTATNPVRIRTWDGETGQFVACLFVYEGYWLDFGLPKQSALSLNDNGIDPDGIEVFEGKYTVTTNPGDCPM